MSSTSFNIYDASAGSGKTYTLVKEYLKILFKSAYKDVYKNILAITFTNKAVGEMKERIIETLKQFSEDTILTEPNSMFKDLCKELNVAPEKLSKKSKNILESIIHNYAAFDISTIDKFTQKVIRTFAYDLHLPLNFEVELDTDTLLAKAIDNLIASAGTEKELTKTLIDFAIEKADDDKSWDIAYDFNPVAKLLVNENHVPYVELLKNKTLDDFKKLKKYLRREIENIKVEITQEAQSTLEMIHLSGVKYYDFSRSSLPNHFKKLSNEDFSVAFTSNWQSDLVEGNSLYPGRVSQDIATLIDGLQTNLSKVFSKTKQLIINYNFLKNIYKNVTPLSVLNEINKEVRKIKEEQNLLLISEFNSIIGNHIKKQPAPFIYERIGEKFKHYFIDEFQDTSKMQWENLVPLLENSLSSENGSVMLVGDAKQAIYRWRGGKAEQFIDLYNGNNNPFHVKVNKEHLPVNYRSYKEIVKFNNAFFKHISSFVFSNEEYSKLYQNSHQDCYKNHQGFVDITLLEIDKDDDKDIEYPIQVLKTITNCIENGFKLNDICVLVRKKKEGVAVAKYLSENGIDIISSETLLIGNAPEVKFIINLLKYILEPQNLEVKIEVISYLGNKKLQVDDIHAFYKKLINLDVGAFFVECSHLGFNFNYSEALQTAVYEVIEAIIYGFNLNKTSNAYLQFFLDFTLDYENKKNSNLTDFIAHFETKKESLTIVSPEGQNAVKIMTIHKSKGLEFPVVIFPYADLNIYKENSPKIWFPLDPESFQGFPIAYINYNKNIDAINEVGEALYTQHQSELELDNINLLYVALTRPVEQLYIISNKTQSNRKNETLNSYNDLLIHYLKHIGKWEESKLNYSFGDQKRVVSKHKNLVITEKQKMFISIPKKKHGINIVTTSGNLWDTSQKEAIERGNLIHDMMSQIKTKNDIEITTENFITSGVINENQAVELKTIVENIVNHNLIAHLFSPDVTVYNEKDIITKQGKIWRPDRVVINKNNEATIVDYKTGAQDSNHLAQIEDYKYALKDMGFEVNKGVLIYTNDTIEIKEV
ncbi:UvrD-helicase domain-containing protein [Pontimicrobium aquaticum]|uniref:DNA 3'-5' helicase n=1 Tax=Pontimicrobium aquaticum TaxID=2565367 RepID=A0A4U0F331_9FLAO|nr:UvrD-helicase domain-containing protein [Pontimicrobium aquaticum]TJY38194.1 DNA helicase UvrD [Pontimicrobium aquaticum]